MTMLNSLTTILRPITLRTKDGDDITIACWLVGSVEQTSTAHPKRGDRDVTTLSIVGRGRIEVLGRAEAWSDCVYNGGPVPGVRLPALVEA